MLLDRRRASTRWSAARRRRAVAERPRYLVRSPPPLFLIPVTDLDHDDVIAVGVVEEMIEIVRQLDVVLDEGTMNGRDQIVLGLRCPKNHPYSWKFMVQEEINAALTLAAHAAAQPDRRLAASASW